MDQSLIVLLQAFLKTKKLPNETAKDYMSKWALAVRYSGIGDDPEDRSWVETRLHGKCFTCLAEQTTAAKMPSSGSLAALVNRFITRSAHLSAETVLQTLRIILTWPGASCL